MTHRNRSHRKYSGRDIIVLTIWEAPTLRSPGARNVCGSMLDIAMPGMQRPQPLHYPDPHIGPAATGTRRPDKYLVAIQTEFSIG